MNKITIRCDPRFYLNVTLEEVRLLTEMGKLHYDFACKQSVMQGGFIYGWCNRLTPMDGEELPEDNPVTANFGELDRVLKILELRGPLTIEKKLMADRLRDHITEAIRIANEQLRQIEFNVVEYSKDERVEMLRAKPLADDDSSYESVEQMLHIYHIPQFGLKEEK
jgi:hypothetical protein